MALPKPVSRADMYLSYLNYTKGLTLANLPKPVSRADMYLYNLCINRGIGGGSGGSNVTLNGEPQTNFNFIGDENSTISALQIGEKTYSFDGGSSSGTTTDNVVDRAGRTQEQINQTFYKRMCKEIPSPSGEPITVENGEEGYVLSAEIKGNTQLFKRAKGSQGEWIAIPNDEARDTVAFEYKLDSTQAIITNNGESYPIYEPTIQGKTRILNGQLVSLEPSDPTLLNLDSVQDVYDEVNLSMKQLTKKIGDMTLNGSESWSWGGVDSSKNIGYVSLPLEQIAPNQNMSILTLNNLFTDINGGEGHGRRKEGLCLTDGKYLRIMYKGGDVRFSNLSTFKQYLADNNLRVKYVLNQPMTQQLTEELVPTILTHNKTNILDVGGAVKPSSFKVTVPVDRLAEIEARLQALENTTVDVVLNK